MDSYSENFKTWMDARNLTAETLAPLINKGVQTLKNWRSQGVPSRESVRSYVTAFMEQYDKEKAEELEEMDTIVLHISAEQFEAWNQAALNKRLLIKDWAVSGLDSMAKAEFARERLRVAEEESYGGKYRFPIHGCVAAGAPVHGVNLEFIDLETPFKEGNYGLVVSGDSMSPGIPDGSVIEVEPLNGLTPKRGTVVVYTDSVGSSLKRLQLRKACDGEEELADARGNLKLLESDNPDYPNVEIMEEGKLEAKFVRVVQ